ncbi:MAG: hypothetical protein HOO96_00440, partial [Polyangiaceae bacterium]|nr:hypothetical protein [Polyangiaceae bacterium]
MKRASCDRVWEVEAVRDGRLLGAARADARRHAEGCEVCGADTAYLEALAAGLRAMPSGSDDEVALRRLRGRVLAAADAELAARAMA